MCARIGDRSRARYVPRLTVDEGASLPPNLDVVSRERPTPGRSRSVNTGQMLILRTRPGVLRAESGCFAPTRGASKYPGRTWGAADSRGR